MYTPLTLPALTSTTSHRDTARRICAQHPICFAHMTDIHKARTRRCAAVFYVALRLVTSTGRKCRCGELGALSKRSNIMIMFNRGDNVACCPNLRLQLRLHFQALIMSCPPKHDKQSGASANTIIDGCPETFFSTAAVAVIFIPIAAATSSTSHQTLPGPPRFAVSLSSR